MGVPSLKHYAFRALKPIGSNLSPSMKEFLEKTFPECYVLIPQYLFKCLFEQQNVFECGIFDFPHHWIYYTKYGDMIYKLSVISFWRKQDKAFEYYKSHDIRFDC